MTRLAITRTVVTTLMIGGLLVTAPQMAAGQDEPPATADNTTSDDRQQQYEQLAKQLTNSVWRGRFATDGDPGLSDEEYHIASATKLPTGDLWMIKTRIKYGERDITVPLPIKIVWAGTTPMIVCDHVTIPGLGTFDARVVIAGDRYAGTWQHGSVGGHLFGTIESAE